MKGFEIMDCRSCPRNCGIDRSKVRGFCGTTREFKLAKAYLHPYEGADDIRKRRVGDSLFLRLQPEMHILPEP